MVEFVFQLSCLDVPSIYYDEIPNLEFWGVPAFEVGIFLHPFLSCFEVCHNQPLNWNEVVDVSLLGIVAYWHAAWIGTTQVSAIVGEEGWHAGGLSDWIVVGKLSHG
jgi:hypothetical protein